MFSKRRMTKGTESNTDKIERIKRALEEADAVIIGAGAGLSTSAGFTYSGERFRSFLRILRKSTDFTICIPVASIPTIPWRNTGRTGADISM